MNVLELLGNELKGKNWSKEEKARYLYIRSCQLFSYDERYQFIDSQEELLKIRNKIIDLENLIDNHIVCTTHTREVISVIMKELLSIDCKELGSGHMWVTFNDGIRNINADGTNSSDLARTKIGLTTTGYNPVEREYNFQTDLEIVDKKIGYIQEHYENDFLQQRIDTLFMEFIQHSPLDSITTQTDDFLIHKLYTVKELFEKYKLTDYSDSKYCISYLIRKVLGTDERILRTIFLYDKSDEENWEFINIYPFKLENEILYFTLKQEGQEYCFYEITQSDVRSFVKTLKGINKDVLYTDVIMR